MDARKTQQQKMSQDSDETTSSVSSSPTSMCSLMNIEVNYSTDSELKKIESELSIVRIQLKKNESELTREMNKLNTNNLQMERHGINLIEWENCMKLKMNQIDQFVESFKMQVHYSNETQLNKQLFQNRIYLDYNTELFALEEKIDYLVGIINQLHSVHFDLRSKIVELNKIQNILHVKQTKLQNQRSRKYQKEICML